MEKCTALHSAAPSLKVSRVRKVPPARHHENVRRGNGASSKPAALAE